MTNMTWLRRGAVALLTVGPTACDETGYVPPAPEVSLRAGGGNFAPLSFDDNPGALNAYLYVPATAPTEPAPLVVAMHACSQTATTYRAAGWEELADELGFYVLYPEQTAANNALTCFNWAGEYGNPDNLERGLGENQSIISMIDAVKAAHAIDDTQIYATGHSGGGAQVSLMLATWPDVFAGGGTFAGIPYHCTTVFAQVSNCLSPGIDKTPEVHGQFVLDAFPGFTGTYPRLTIWQGSADNLVAPMNQQELLEQWSYAHGVDMTPDVTETVGAAERVEYHDAAGNAVIETVTVNGGGHATFNSPGDGCGASGLYFEDQGLCGPRMMAEFWGLGAPAVGETGGETSGGDSSASASGGGSDGDSSASASGGGSGGDGGSGSTSGSGDTSDGGDAGGDAGGSGGDTADGDDPPSPKGVGQCRVGDDPLGGIIVLGGLGLLGLRRRRR